MERYTVNFKGDGGQETRLLIPLSPSSSVADLTIEAWKRLTRLGIAVGKNELQFQLDGSNGPLIFEDDTLEFVIVDPKNETIFATRKIGDTDPTSTYPPVDRSSTQPDHIKIRVITPELAASTRNPTDILPLECAFSESSSIAFIREQIASHLSIQITESSDMESSQVECNCAFARVIASNGPFQIGNIHSITPNTENKRPYLYIHSNNVVELKHSVPTQEWYLKDTVSDLLEQTLGSEGADSNIITYFVAQDIATNGPEIPIITVCPRNTREHKQNRLAASIGAGIQGSSSNPLPLGAGFQGFSSNPIPPGDEESRLSNATFLDLHTSEAPISTSRSYLTIGELGLHELAVDGIIPIFAVVRKGSGDSLERKQGQMGIYSMNDCWQPRVKQSERGSAMFLSSLRVFIHKKSNEAIRDSSLHILHLLTGFPPALRTLRILMNRSSPTSQECAALCQSLYECIGNTIPLKDIGLDSDRVFEGSRLFFGSVLDLCKAFQMSDDTSSYPYNLSMESISLVNSETHQYIRDPVDTSIGLLERGCFNALQSGIIKYSNPEISEIIEIDLNSRTRRAIMVSEGIQSVIVFDLSILYSSRSFGNYPKYNHLNNRKYRDLQSLSEICSKNDLPIVSPGQLLSAPNPSLTLDKDGLGAVYLGLAPCANDPAKNTIIFRPTKGGDTTIDIAVVEQLLKPIIESREADGTAILDSLGHNVKRMVHTPDEILMICVDCSQSMAASADFDDITVDDDVIMDGQGNGDNCDIDFSLPSRSLEEVKEELTDYYSFDDMVHTVKAAPIESQRDIASELLDRLLGLKSAELKHLNEKLVEIEQRNYWYSRREEKSKCESKIDIIKHSIIGLTHHKNTLSDFLVFRARLLTDNDNDSNWDWTPGSDVPITSDTIVFQSTSLSLTVPDDCLCPMTRELFNDPVTDSSSHVYERAAITRWFQMGQTSPLTGLPVSDQTLQDNRVIKKKVYEWVTAKHLIDNPSSVSHLRITRSKRRSSRSSTITIRFVSSQGTFEREVPKTTTAETLYHIVFRGLRGRYADFDLRLKGRILPLNAVFLSAAPYHIEDQELINIILPTTNQIDEIASSGGAVRIKRCLIKVYIHTNELHFAYWVPQNTSATVASIMFKLWRYEAENDISYSPEELEGRYNYNQLGDNWYNFSHMSSWDTLSQYLTLYAATGVLGEESLYTTTKDMREPVAPRHLTDKPLVFKLALESHQLNNSRPPALIRLSALQQMFDQFVNRILAYSYQTHIGLITFDDSAVVAQPLTHIIEDFRTTVNALKAKGDTALWDALCIASDQIMTYSGQYPSAKRRILCISDGVDTNSSRNPSDVALTLARNNIVVDSFCIGSSDYADLRAISWMTKGFNFHPMTLEASMAICELEPVLSLGDRDMDAITTSRRYLTEWPRRLDSATFSIARSYAKPESVTRDVFPKRKEHPRLKDHFIAVTSVGNRRALPPSSRADALLRNSRLLIEVKNVSVSPHPQYDVFVSESDISFWKVVMQGPPGSVYATGTFVLYLHMEENYPAFAPKCRFVTPIYHPNVNRHGRICHSIFDRNWTADTSNSDVLATVYGLLFQPDYSDPV
jgi:ubiquitin-protein ligase